LRGCRVAVGPGRVAHAALPVVVAAVPVADLHGRVLDVVEGVQVHREEVAADLLDVAGAVEVDAAVLAKVPRGRRGLVTGEILLALGDLQRAGRRALRGHIGLLANAAVAARSCRRVDRNLEANGAAVTASLVDDGLGHARSMTAVGDKGMSVI